MSKIINKMETIKDNINKVIDILDNRGVMGPISFLEEAVENLDSAIEEMEIYENSGEE